MADTNASSAGFHQEWQHFLVWWKQHLWECIPETLRAKIVQSRRPAMLSLAEDKFWVAGAPLSEHKPFAHSALAQGARGDVALVIGESNGFRRDIDLPLAVEHRLSQVLTYELDRLTPLRSSELYYDFRVKRRNPSAANCTVELVAAPRTRVDPMLELAKQKGLTVSRILLSPADVDTRLNMQSKAVDLDASQADKSRWINWALLATCCLLVIALVATPLWQMRQYVIELQPIEVAAKADAEMASVLQRQLEKQVGDYNLPLSRKHTSPLVVQVVDDLSKRLPDDTWAQTLEIKTTPNQKAREVIIQGETGSGGKLLQLVQESPVLKDPTFKAAMTRVAPNAERFHIAGELVAAALPQQVLLSDENVLITVPPAPGATAGSPATKAGPANTAATPAPASTQPAASTSTPAVAPATAAPVAAPAAATPGATGAAPAGPATGAYPAEPRRPTPTPAPVVTEKKL